MLALIHYDKCSKVCTLRFAKFLHLITSQHLGTQSGQTFLIALKWYVCVNFQNGKWESLISPFTAFTWIPQLTDLTVMPVIDDEICAWVFFAYLSMPSFHWRYSHHLDRKFYFYDALEFVWGTVEKFVEFYSSLLVGENWKLDTIFLTKKENSWRFGLPGG